MGANFCGFRRRPSPPNRPPEKDSGNENCGLAASVMQFINPRSLWAAMKVKKRQIHPPEKQELQLYKSNCKVLTLEDWITSSPDFSRPHDHTNISGGETPAHKQYSSRKIHPSFDGDRKQESLPKSVKSFSVEISMRKCEAKNGEAESTNTSFCRTKSGKINKKVSFRSPEVADVFVLDHSPGIHMLDIHESKFP